MRRATRRRAARARSQSRRESFIASRPRKNQSRETRQGRRLATPHRAGPHLQDPRRTRPMWHSLVLPQPERPRHRLLLAQLPQVRPALDLHQRPPRQAADLQSGQCVNFPWDSHPDQILQCGISNLPAGDCPRFKPPKKKSAKRPSVGVSRFQNFLGLTSAQTRAKAQALWTHVHNPRNFRCVIVRFFVATK